MDRRSAAGALVALAACIACSAAAPTLNEHTSLDLYDDTSAGCYYNFQHYGEGDRIMTNEPCLNCTCHNRMLMCYLRVCPFTKPIGQDCTVEKRADQCCPIVTCPDVPVDLLTSTSTTSLAEYGATGIGKPDKYGCSINGKYFSEGSKVPPTPNKPCEHCYCIRNMTTCVMQECTLHVDGCTPIYLKDVCCPVRYSCDHLDDETLLLDDMTTTVRPTPGFLLTTTTSSPVTQMTQDCVHDDKIFADGALIKTEKACEHCYCMKGDIVCVVQECGTPMENEGKNCTSLPPREGQCCPDTYICEGDEMVTESLELYTTEIQHDELTTFTPPRRHGVEGSGYRNEPDNISYIATPSTEIESEGSGYEQKLDTPQDSNEIISTTVIQEQVTTKIPITEEVKPKKEDKITEHESSLRPQEGDEKIITITEKEVTAVEVEEEQKTTDEYHVLDEGTTSIPPLDHTEFVTKSDTKELISQTTQGEIFSTEENKSTITSDIETKVTTDTAKHELSTTIGIEENYISTTTSSNISEEGDGVTTDKESELASHVFSEKETQHAGDYTPSTSSTPFLEEVEKVTTETQEQHLVTDNISETEAFEPHKDASTMSVPEKEVNEKIDTISSDNILPDTESHEYIPIATSSSISIGDEPGKGTTPQEDSITRDFNEEEMNKPHKYTPTVPNLIKEENEFVTTESIRESSISNEIPIVSDDHKYISSTIGLNIISEDDQPTTEVFVHDTVTDRTRKDDDSYQYTPSTTNIMAMAEESSVAGVEEGKKVTELDASITDKYISTSTSTLYLDDHKTTSSNFGDAMTGDNSKEETTIPEKDFTSTLEFTSSKPDENVSTESSKYETITPKFDEKESYEFHKIHSTTIFSIEDEYITTTEYTGKDQEFITNEISQSGTASNENIANASSTPFLEEIEKATPEISEDNISSTLGESDIRIPEKHLVNTETIPTLEEEVTTIFESHDIIDVTPPNTIIAIDKFDPVIPVKTTQDESLKHGTTISSTMVADEKQTYGVESMTTEPQLYSTSSPNSITTKENQFIITTEPIFRKEDNVVQSISTLNEDITSSSLNVESTTITVPIVQLHEIPTISALPEYTHESHKPVYSEQPTVETTIGTVTLDKNNVPISIDEASIVSTSTHTIDKLDSFEISTINPGENEIHEDKLSSSGRIPGEGDCLLNGVTYKNESAVPSTNKCHSGCRCLSSIISCDPIICSPPPEYMDNCQPTYDSPESCCPTYVCDQVRETLPPLPYKHVTTPETPKESILIECHGDECEIGEHKKQLNTESSEPCSGGICSTEIDHQQETSKCGPQGCNDASQTSIHTPTPEKTELCNNGKCERPVAQAPQGELCEGASCKSIPETLPHGLQQDSESQEFSPVPCTDDSCRRKETINIEQKPVCSGANCLQNENLPDEAPKDAQHSTYSPIVELNTDAEATYISSVSPDMVTEPTKQDKTDEKLSTVETPNYVSINKERVTELPEFVTSNVYPTENEKDLQSIFITESTQPSTDEPQKSIGDSHTLESKPPVIDEEKIQPEVPSTTVTEVAMLTIETSTEISEDMIKKEEETDTKNNQPESDIKKPQGQMIVTDLPLHEFNKETTPPDNSIFTSPDTDTRAPVKDEIITTIFDSAEHEVSTEKLYEYTTFVPNRDEVGSVSSTPTHISITYEPSLELTTTTSSSTDLVPLTEKNIEVTKSEEILPSLNNQDSTTGKFESENDNDYTTPVNNLEPGQVNANTDLPYLHISGNVEDTFDKNKLSPSAKPDAESYSTISEQLVTHVTTESVLNEKEYTHFVPTVTNIIDLESHFTETDDAKSESPILNTVEEKLSTETPFSPVTEIEGYVVEDNETKTTLTTSETHEKKIDTDSSSAVTESEVHVSMIDIPKITLKPATIKDENIEAETPDSLLTDSETLTTVSEEINTSLPTFITKEKETATDSPIAVMTEVGLQKDKVDATTITAPTSVLNEEITSLYVTEPGYSVERKTTSKSEEEDNIKTDAVDSESEIYGTRKDEKETTLTTTNININEKVKTVTPSIYVTEPVQRATETEEIRTTLSTLMTEEEPFISKIDEKETTSPEYITEPKKVYTERPGSQFTKVTTETTILDETRTTSPTLVTDEKVEAELPGTIVTEYKPHIDEVTETKTTTPDVVTEERITALDEAKRTSPTFITTEQTIEEIVPSSPFTQSKEHYSTLDDTKVTLSPHITEVENIKGETEIPVSSQTDTYLHENKATTILSEPHSETETQTTYVTESEDQINIVDQTSIIPVTIAGDKIIESQYTSTHVTESGVLATDNDIIQPTLSVTDSEREKLDSEAHTSYVTELGSQSNDEKETKTTTLSSMIHDDTTKINSQSSYITEPEVYVSKIDGTESTTSITKEIIQEEIQTATQSVLIETETQKLTHVTEEESTVSEFEASTEKNVDLHTDEGDEIKTIQPTSIIEEEKNKLDSALPHDLGDHTDKLDEIKTESPVAATEKESVETETTYSQVTESLVYVTKVDETSTITSASHLSEEDNIEVELTPIPMSESEGHATKGDETKTTASESNITEEEKTGSGSPVTEPEIYGTVFDETSSTLYTPIPDIGIDKTKEPVYISEVHPTVQEEMKTTIPTFITVGETIKTETSTDYVTESIDLITPDIHKFSTSSEHIITDVDGQTTQPSTVSEIGLEDKDIITVEKEHDNAEITLFSESTTEMKYVENITNDEEFKSSTESSKVEPISSVSVSEFGTTPSGEFETKVTGADLINEVHPGFYITEDQQLSTDITETTFIEKDTSVHQDQYTKSPELYPVTTIVAATESDKIVTASVVEDKQKPVTSSPDVQQFVTKEYETGITTLGVLETQEEIVTEKEIVSTDLPATTILQDITDSDVPLKAQEELTSSELEPPNKITLAPESLTTNLQEVSQTYHDDHHINEEEQTKIKPTIDYIDSSTIKSELQNEMITTPQVQYFTEKQETIPIEHDSSIVTHEIMTKKPDTAEINSITSTQIREETTEHEQIKHTFAPVSENTEIIPDVIELEEHTHKTLLEVTTVTSIDDQPISQSIPENDGLENQIPEQPDHKASDEQTGIKESTEISEDTSTTLYEVEKSTTAATPVEETSKEILSINTTPATQASDMENVSIPEAVVTTEEPFQEDKAETPIVVDEITLTTLKPTSPIVEKESPAPVTTTSVSQTKPSDSSLTKAPSVTQPTDEISPLPEEEHLPPSGGSGYGGEPDYVEEDQAFGPGTCRYGGKVYVSAQQIPRDDPCDFCFCFRSDIICLQQSCPPPIHGCHEEPIQGFCCPRYECPVSMATTLNVTTTTTTTTTTLPPHFPTHSYKGAAQRKGCQIRGHSYKVGEVVRASSGPCLHCTCGGDGQMKCDPKACTPEPMLRQMIAAAVSAKRRR